MVDDSAFWIVNSHALSSGVTHFNYIGQPRVNSISGTTEFTDNAYFLGEINGTLATTAQPNITSVGTLTSLTSSGTVSAQDVTATGVLTGTLASIPQPNITRIGPGLDFTETGKVTIDNLAGGNYSPYSYDITAATKQGVIYPSLDPMIFEVRYPDTDIYGRVVTY